MLRVRSIEALLGIVFLTACASTNGGAVAGAQPKAFRCGDGRPASLSEIVDAASAADVVFLGENHGHPLGLATAAKVFEDVLARSPDAALSLEFFERDEQSRLDDYLEGIADRATFERRTERKKGNFPPGHQSMIECAKEHSRPVHASNSPWQYTTLARTAGYERLAELSPEQRRLFRIPLELVGGRYRADFERVMTPSDPKDRPEPDELARRLEAAFHAQQLWDWTMADSIASALANGEAPIVHVVGHFHVDFHGGTPQALDRLRLGTRMVVITFIDAWSDSLRDEDKERADFVVYVGPSPAE